MKSNVLTIMKKEFDRFFKDKRTVVTTLFMPGIILYAIYSFMGQGLANMFGPDVDFIPSAYVINMPEGVRDYLEQPWMTIVEVDDSAAEQIKDRISDGAATILVVFPRDFDERVMGFYTRPVTELAPNIEIFFNSADQHSMISYQSMVGMLDSYEASIANVFDINRGVYAGETDLATDEAMSASIIAALMPMMLMIFLYSGCMGLAPDSIAGEKERGTIATILVTPLKRSELAIGKILSLAALSFLSGIGTTIAMILSLPNMLGGGDDVRVDIYGVTDFLFLALVALSTILFLVAVTSIISAFAKSIKEATTYLSPLMILVMVVSVSGMFVGGESTTVHYMIPLYGSVQSMSGIFALDYSATNIIIASLSNVVFACIGGLVLTKMFNSEKVMFSK